VSPGDEVLFDLVRQLRDGKLAPRKIRRHVCSGVVTAVKAAYGFVLAGDDQRPIFFHATEVEGRVDLHPGDQCDFCVGQSSRTKGRVALRLRRTTAAPPAAAPHHKPLALQARKQTGDGAQAGHGVIRQAKGPDGTRGFLVARSTAPPSFGLVVADAASSSEARIKQTTTSTTPDGELSHSISTETDDRPSDGGNASASKPAPNATAEGAAPV